MAKDIKRSVEIVFHGKYGEFARYAFIGAGTTAVNFLAYAMLYDVLSVNLTISNAVAVVLANIYSYCGNKIFVFQTVRQTLAEFLREIGLFFFSRAVTIVLEIAGVPIVVSLLKEGPYLAKIEVVAFITIVNFFVAKFVVFRRRGTQEMIDQEDEE